MIRIDPDTDEVSRRIPVGSAPSALATSGGSVWAATTASRASHRGGTLRYELAPEAGVFQCTCIDPAEPAGDGTPLLSLAYDGLIAFRRVGGIGGSALVADLATSVPQPDDGGRTYTFQLRAGLRFSDGTAVRPTDFRASMQRFVRLAGAWPYGELAGIDDVHAAPVRSITGHRDRRRRPDDHDPPPATRCRVPVQARAAVGLRAARAHTGEAAAEHSCPGNRPVHDHVLRAGARGPPAAQPELSLVVERGAPRRLSRRDHGRDLPGRGRAGRRGAARPLGRRRVRRRVQRPGASRAGPRDRPRRRQPRALGALAADQLPLPQRARAAVRRPAGPAGAQLRHRSPAHGRARGRPQPRGRVLPDDSAGPARLHAHLPVHPRPDAGPRLVGAGSRSRPPVDRRIGHPRRTRDGPGPAAVRAGRALRRCGPASLGLPRPGAGDAPRSLLRVRQRLAPPRSGRVLQLDRRFPHVVGTSSNRSAARS